MEAQDGPRAYYLPLAIKTISLIAIYATYGVLQERIIKGHYDSVNTAILNNEESQPPNDSFTSAPFLVLCNRLVSLVTGIVLAQIQFAKAQYAELPSSSSSTPCRAQSWREAISEQLTRMRPSSNFLSYAIVAGLNNAATLAQYSSLAYLSFTTSTLGKSAKMVPVLIIGHLWYGKRYKTRQWVGVAIVILGIWGYLTSLMGVDDTDKKKQEMAPSTNVIGIACLLAYLFFDGLTSTMQERLFGQAKNREETSRMLGITPGIVDQMVRSPLPSPIPPIVLIINNNKLTNTPDLGQRLLHPHSPLAPPPQPPDPHPHLPQPSPHHAPPPTTHPAPLLDRNRRSPPPFPRHRHLRRPNRKPHHDSAAVRQHRV